MAKPKVKPQDQINPLSGLTPNSFTQAKDRELPGPTNVRPFTAKRMADPSGALTKGGNSVLVPDEKASSTERRRLRKLHVEATKPGGVVDAQIGYRPPSGGAHHGTYDVNDKGETVLRPVDTPAPAMGQRDFAWTMGVHHMFPNESARRGMPAINEPHEANPHVTAQRRAEDLSEGEYKKASDVLAHYGHDARNPARSLTDTIQRQANRVVSEHIRAGVEESASQLFYGGSVSTTDISDPKLDAMHAQGVTAAGRAVNDYTRQVVNHPEFNRRVPRTTHQERTAIAKAMVNQAAADTSPNSKWRSKSATSGEVTWPNLEQAHESVNAALESREARFITGRTPNENKAANRVEDMIKSGDYSTHQYGNPMTAPKTVAFRGALNDRDAADAFAVADVHHASVMAPGLPTSKSVMYDHPSGGRVRVHADEPASASRGLRAREKATNSGKIIPEVGLSRPEEMLDKAKGHVHALNDRSMREVSTNMGTSRGVNYADNVHPWQGALWGSQQVQRPDVDVSHADQYPVVRDWGAEGHATLTDLGHRFFGQDTRLMHMGPQFTENPNKVGINRKGTDAHVPGRSKPYDVM